jgi:hypothetical protein
MDADGLSHVGPNREKDTLALVVAGPVFMGFAEVSGSNRAVDRRDDLSKRNLLGSPSQHVAPSDTALGPNQPGALEGEEDLFEIRLWQSGAVRDVAD